MAVSIQGRGIASQTIATDTDTAGEKFAVNASTKNIIAVMKVSSRTDGSYTLKIQHSHDGSNWEALKTAGAAVTTNDTTYLSYSEAVDGACFGYIRIVVTSASTTTGATVEASVYYGD